MGRALLGAIVTFVLFPITARAQDVSIAAIDSDALAVVTRELEIRGYDTSEGLDRALREFAYDHSLESPAEEGKVSALALDELGAGHAIAIRWGAAGPRAPELSAEEIKRLNTALRDRGFTDKPPRAVVDEETLQALRSFQRVTGHPVQRGDYVERRWLFILGVATEDSGDRAS